jgi:hypothetical protein
MAYKQTPLNMGPSPLKGNYESGVDGIRYVSTAPAFQDMQNKIAGGTAKAIDGLKPKEPDTSKETNSSDYDNSVINNYYYGNQDKGKGKFNFDVDVPTVKELKIKGFDPKDFPTTEGSGGGGSDAIKNRTKINVRLSDSQAWKGMSSEEKLKYGSLGNFKKAAQKYRDDFGTKKWDKKQAERTGVSQVGTRTRKYETKNQDPEKLISDITTGNYYGI